MGDAIPISCLGLSENGHDFMGHETPKNPDLLPSVYHDQVTAVGQMGNSTFGQIQYKHQ